MTSRIQGLSQNDKGGLETRLLCYMILTLILDNQLEKTKTAKSTLPNFT